MDRQAHTGDTVIVKSREMTGRSRILPWWLGREGVKTTQIKIRWPCWSDGSWRGDTVTVYVGQMRYCSLKAPDCHLQTIHPLKLDNQLRLVPYACLFASFWFIIFLNFPFASLMLRFLSSFLTFLFDLAPFLSFSVLSHFYFVRARICQPFQEPRNRFPAWRAGTTTIFDVPVHQATLAGGIDP